MSQTYFTILTNLGAALLAQATASGTQLKITHLAVGDGNGNVPSPLPTQTQLIHEVRRSAINTVYTDENNENHIIIEQVIPPEEGGFYIRELGVFDDKGNLIAVGNCPPSYKPKLSEGSGRTQVINMVIMVDNTGTVELKIDASTVLATRKYVDDLISSSMAKVVPNTRKVNNKALSVDITLTAGDVGAYTKAETDTKVSVAQTAANNANTNANGRVPSTRKVNNKALSADITLTAGDVGAYTKAETDTKVSTAQTAANNANTNANGRVPSTRKVNNKALSADITLTAGDIGAYTKAETDTKVNTDATTTVKGRVQLNSAINSTAENQAATPGAVKKAYDLANNTLNAVNKTHDIEFIYPNGSESTPSTITKSGEIIISDPYPSKAYDYIAQLYVNCKNGKKRWLDVRFIYENGASWGVNVVRDSSENKILIKAGASFLINANNQYAGLPNGYTETSGLASAQIRLRIIK